MIDFFYREWKEAETEGDLEHAEYCKIEYIRLTLENMNRPHLQRFEKLEMFPLVWLN